MSSPMQQCWINLLPEELISNILVTVVDPDMGCGSDLKPKFLQLVQLVCRKWKLVACTTPALWTSLNLRCIRSEHLQLYLKRSGSLLLEVQLSLPLVYHDDQEAPDDSEHQEIFQDTVTTIHRFAQRIWRLEFRQVTAETAYQWITSLSPHIPNLHELAIYAHLSDRGSKLDLIMPRLRSLILHAYRLDWEYMPVAAMLEKLSITETRGCRVDRSEIAATLRAYPALRELTLTNQFVGNDDSGRVAGTSQPVVLGALETLSLGYFSIEQLEWILSTHSAPQLKALRLTRNERYGYEGAVEMRIPHFPVLERLVLEMQASIAVEVAKQTTSIKHLAFMHGWARDSKETVDGAFVSLASHWQTLGRPLPLETLKTEGVLPSSVLSLVTRDGGKAVPSLRKIAMHYSGAFLSKNEEDFRVQAEVRRRLSELVELEVYGLSHEALSARESVYSWVEEQNWIRAFRVDY